MVLTSFSLLRLYSRVHSSVLSLQSWLHKHEPLEADIFVHTHLWNSHISQNSVALWTFLQGLCANTGPIQYLQLSIIFLHFFPESLLGRAHGVFFYFYFFPDTTQFCNCIREYRDKRSTRKDNRHIVGAQKGTEALLLPIWKRRSAQVAKHSFGEVAAGSFFGDCWQKAE